jgi:hypothetical protein
MIDALRSAVDDRPLGPVTHRIDPAIAGIFAGWARRSRYDRADDLGLAVDDSLETIIRTYLRDYAPTPGPDRP